MLNVWRRSDATRPAAARLYAAIVARAREPVFFARFGVADTIDGRFDLIALHAWLALDRLRDEAVAQALVDAIFVGFDEGLRDLGVSDIGMGRRIKKLADAFYGRLGAYRAAADDTAMAEALLRNLYRGAEGHAPEARILARYVASARTALAASPPDALDFGALPE